MFWGPNTREDTRQFLGRALESQKTPPRTSFNMAVELAAEARVIGAIEIRIVSGETRTAELGYAFARDVWGHGYAVEAAEAMLRQAFEGLKARRVTATCDVRNTRSWRLMERLGLRREGCFRGDVRVRGRWRDSYLYALLATEWRARPNP
jgi:RimJ/RimL family protein N-acetyltransferase